MADPTTSSAVATERSPSGRRHTDHGRERKQQLLEAAEQLFAATGYRRTRIEDICGRAGVAKGLFYWYFPNKEALFAELVRTMRQRLRVAQADAMDPAGDPLTRLRQGAEASVRFIAVHATYFAVLDVERAGAEHAALLREGSDIYLNDTLRVVRAAQSAGLVVDGDPTLLAIGVLGAVSSFSHAWRNSTIDLDADALAEVVGAWIERALRAE